MGYATTLIVMYGIYLTPEQAKNIFDKYFYEGEKMQYDNKDTITEEVAYVHRIHGAVYRERNIPQMVSDGADSRVHSLVYSDDCAEHCLGIYMASKGYGCSDNIEEHIKNWGGKTLQNFNKYILPILQTEGITEEPKVRILTQVW